MFLNEPPSSLFSVNEFWGTPNSKNWQIDLIYQEIISYFRNEKKLSQIEPKQPLEKIKIPEIMEQLAPVPTSFKEVMLRYKDFNKNLKIQDQKNHQFFEFIDPRTVSPNALTKRFESKGMLNVDGGPRGFQFFKHPLHEKFLTKVIALVDSALGKYYFEGPQGIGKSFALLYVVLQMRKQKEKFRVIYVNNPELWKSAETLYIANEIIWAFAEDEFTFPPPDGGSAENPLKQWYEILSSPFATDKDFFNFLLKAYQHCQSNGLQMVAFLDQENAVRNKWNNNTQEYYFPFSFYSGMHYVFNIFTFASANNNTRMKKTEGWTNLGPGLEITFRSFCFPEKYIEAGIRVALDLNKTADDNGSLLRKVLAISGGNTLEVFSFLEYYFKHIKTPQELPKLIEKYIDESENTFQIDHSKYKDEAFKDNNEKKEIFRKAVAYLDLDLRVPIEFRESYDRRLMYLQDNKFWSLCPAAKAVLQANLYMKFDAVEEMVSKYLSEDIGGDGYVLEHYILHCMKKISQDKAQLVMSYRKILHKENGSKLFLIDACERFAGIPHKKPDNTTLFIPFSKCYPDIDCLIYDKTDSTIYPIQITMTQRNHKDSYQSWKENAERKWLQVFKDCKVSFIWLVGTKKKYTKTKQDYWVVTFDSLPFANLNYFTVFTARQKELERKLKKVDENLLDVEIKPKPFEELDNDEEF